VVLLAGAGLLFRASFASSCGSWTRPSTSTNFQVSIRRRAIWRFPSYHLFYLTPFLVGSNVCPLHLSHLDRLLCPIPLSLLLPLLSAVSACRPAPRKPGAEALFRHDSEPSCPGISRPCIPIRIGRRIFHRCRQSGEGAVPNSSLQTFVENTSPRAGRSANLSTRRWLPQSARTRSLGVVGDVRKARSTGTEPHVLLSSRTPRRNGPGVVSANAMGTRAPSRSRRARIVLARPAQPFSRVRTMEGARRQTISRHRFSMALFVILLRLRAHSCRSGYLWSAGLFRCRENPRIGMRLALRLRASHYFFW